MYVVCFVLQDMKGHQYRCLGYFWESFYVISDPIFLLMCPYTVLVSVCFWSFVRQTHFPPNMHLNMKMRRWGRFIFGWKSLWNNFQGPSFCGPYYISSAPTRSKAVFATFLLCEDRGKEHFYRQMPRKVVMSTSTSHCIDFQYSRLCRACTACW